MQIGDKINFNKFKWLVLDIKDGKALIITEGIIEHRRYHDAYKEITWAECSLRKYLNGEFYDRFSAADQSRIIPAINKNHDNQWYGTKGGEDTKDKIFLLSLEEVSCKYFGDSSSKLYSPRKNQRYWYERKDENNRVLSPRDIYSLSVWQFSYSMRFGYCLVVRAKKTDKYADVIKKFPSTLQKKIARGYGCDRKLRNEPCQHGCQGIRIPLDDTILDISGDIKIWLDNEVSFLGRK